MFNKSDKEREFERRIERLEWDLEKAESRHENEQEELRSEHSREIAKKEFEIEKLKDKERISNAQHYKIESLESTIKDLEKQVAVLEMEKSMLEKMVDIDSDVIDVKELVKQVVNKLPEININGSISLGAGGDKNKGK